MSRITAAGREPPRQLEPLDAVASDRHGVARVLEVDAQQIGRAPVVLHDQDAALPPSVAATGSPARGPVVGAVRPRAQRDRERERAADAGLALHPQAAAVEVDDPLRQREAEARCPPCSVRAARPPRWKASKMRSCSASAMPMPVSRTLTCASSPTRRAVDRDRPAVRRELHRVAEQVEDHLLELAARRPGPCRRSGSMSRASEIPWPPARSRTIARPCSIRSGESRPRRGRAPSGPPRPSRGRGSR